MERQNFDAEYIRRLRDGDPAVQENFSRYFGDLITCKLRARRLPPQMFDRIEDIRQITLLRVLTALRRGELENPESLPPYVLGVCNFVSMETWRDLNRASQMPENAPDPPDERVDLDRCLITEENKAIVKAILSKMSAKDQALLRGVCLEERDKDEVCREYGVDRQYLRVLLHRARNRFRAALKKDEAGRKRA